MKMTWWDTPATDSIIKSGQKDTETSITAVVCTLAGRLKSVQSTLSDLISTSVPHARFSRFLMEHRLFQYCSQ